MDSFENNDFKNTALTKFMNGICSYCNNEISINDLVNEYLDDPNQIKDIRGSEPDKVKLISNLALDILKENSDLSADEEQNLRNQMNEASDISTLGLVWHLLWIYFWQCMMQL